MTTTMYAQEHNREEVKQRPMPTQLQAHGIAHKNYELNGHEELIHRCIFKHLFKCAQIRGPRINQVIFILIP